MNLVFPARFGADISPIKCAEILSHIPDEIVRSLNFVGPATLQLYYGTVLTKWYMVSETTEQTLVALPWACDGDASHFRAELPPHLLSILTEYALTPDRRHSYERSPD